MLGDCKLVSGFDPLNHGFESNVRVAQTKNGFKFCLSRSPCRFLGKRKNEFLVPFFPQGNGNASIVAVVFKSLPSTVYKLFLLDLRIYGYKIIFKL